MTLGGKWGLPAAGVLCALFYIAIVLVTREYRGIRPALIMLILSTPYIFTILLSGELRELRLLMPLLFGLFFVYLQLAYLKNRQPAL